MTAEEAAMIMMSGESTNIQPLTVVANGTQLIDSNIDGCNPVTVNVPDTVHGSTSTIGKKVCDWIEALEPIAHVAVWNEYSVKLWKVTSRNGIPQPYCFSYSYYDEDGNELDKPFKSGERKIKAIFYWGLYYGTTLVGIEHRDTTLCSTIACCDKTWKMTSEGDVYLYSEVNNIYGDTCSSAIRGSDTQISFTIPNSYEETIIYNSDGTISSTSTKNLSGVAWDWTGVSHAFTRYTLNEHCEASYKILQDLITMSYSDFRSGTFPL